MKKVFLLAHPAGHSISPHMHNAAFAHLGIAGHYAAWDVAPGDLVAAVERLRAEDVYGANVTVPHKLEVAALMDALSPAAQAMGAVNTVINRGGVLTGHNTDAEGFIKALLDDAGFDPAGRRVLMLGAGGAARAVAYGLLEHGVGDLAVHNRTQARAQSLADALAERGRVRVVDEDAFGDVLRSAELLVNTTSVGMERGGQDPQVSPLPEGLLPERGLVSDLVYRPMTTRLLKDAARAGLRTQNGLPMLVYQGAAAFECWTGQGAPVAVMSEAARDVLKGSSHP